MVVAASLLWLAILIVLTVSDVFTRDWTPLPSNWEAQIQQGVR
jgi:hypothetical protein